MASKPGMVESRRGVRWVETRVAGRVHVEHIRAMVSGFERHGGGAIWLIDASETDSYDPGAIREAVDSFGRLSREHGLERLVALITRPGVRMGASVVAMSLRAIGAGVAIDIVGDRPGLDRAGR